MPEVKTSPLLSAYRLASAAIGAVAPLYLFCRGKIGRGDFLRRHERLGLSYLAKPNSGLALFYAASGVDALALMLLAERLGQLGFRVLVSMRDSEGGRLRPPRLATLLYQLAPLDTP